MARPPNADRARNHRDNRDTHANFTTIKLLGAGKRGGQNEGVYLVKSKSDGETYIEKRVPSQTISSGHAQREVNAMRQCRDHPNIVSIVDATLDSYQLLGYGSTFMQRCELRSLDGLINRYHKRGRTLEDKGFLYSVLWDVAHALCYMATGIDLGTAQALAKKGETYLKCGAGMPLCTATSSREISS
jgi:serine/threonine protein kinase